jgi:transposase
MGAGPMILMCDNQKDRARACPGYAPGQRAGQGYPRDLTDARWQVIAAHLPADRPGRRGRPRVWPVRRIVEAILYVDRTGCAWRYLPADFPPWRTVYGYFAAWRDDGTIVEPASRLPHAFEVLPRRWAMVERTFAWISKHRRTVRDYERLPASHEAMILWAMIALMARRLACSRP